MGNVNQRISLDWGGESRSVEFTSHLVGFRKIGSISQDAEIAGMNILWALRDPAHLGERQVGPPCIFMIWT